jgi:hypothetical protein
MRINKVKQIIVLTLVAGQILVWPFSALAFAPVPQASVVAPLTAIPVSAGGTIAGNNAFNVGIAGVQSLYETCNTILQVFEQGDQATQIGLSFASVLGGGGKLAAAYEAEVNAYAAYTNCLDGTDGIEGVLDDLDAVPSPDTYTSGIKAQMRAQIVAKYNTYVLKYNSSLAKYNVASESVWKALLITILISTTKSVADSLVNHLVSNYKITNLKQYVDSVATLMYDNQFIRDNFPDNQGQMMARAILQNPQLRTQIQPGIYQAANTFFNPTTINPNDPNYYAKMAGAAAPQANPYFMQATYVSSIDQSHANAVATAQRQIAQGSGYKAPVNCAGSLAQQQQIDVQTKAASDLMGNRLALLNNLQTGGGKPADIAKAQADYDAAKNAWNALPYTVTGSNSYNGSSSLANNLTSGSNTQGTAAIVMCEAINSPAILVNQGIDAVFKSLNLGQYNPSNLPGSLANMATQIGSSLILGGIHGGGKSGVINENLLINSAANIAGNAVFPPTSLNVTNANNGIILNTPTPSYSNGTVSSYSLTWQTLPQLSSANYVIISGSGAPPGHQSITGGIAVTPPSTGATYTITVYDTKGTPLATATTSIPPQTNSGTNGGLTLNNTGSPEVAGAFTQKPAFNIRGPIPALTVR